MEFRKILAGLILSAVTLQAAVNPPDKPTPEPAKEPAAKAAGKKAGGRARPAAETVCSLAITWWEAPALAEGEILELGVQTDRGVIRIAPAVMDAGNGILYEGPATAAIVRRAMIPDPSGKVGAPPVETWLPFASIPVGANDQELLAILFATPTQVRARTINLNPASFPFGGFHIYNYSKSRLLCSMGGKVFNADPSTRTVSPLVMTKREVVNFYLGLPGAEGKLQILYRAPLILTEKIRRLYFVLEVTGAEEIENRFVTRTIMQHVAGHKTIESLRGQEAAAAESTEEKATEKPAGKKAEGTAEGTPKTKAQ